MNAGMLKNFSLRHREGMYVRFGMEAFSLFNMPVVSAPNAVPGNHPGADHEPKRRPEMQFALKLVF